MEDLDLFGEVVITLDDVELWLDAVPQIPRNSPRRNYYAKNWDVVSKIKSSKLNGSFAKLINDHLLKVDQANHGVSNISDLYFPSSMYIQ